MKRTFVPAVAAFAFALACSSGAEGPGRLSVALSSPSTAGAVSTAAAPLPDLDAIWVNVTAVRAHSAEGGWVTLDTEPVRLNVLALADAGVDLGLASLPAGTVTQLRLLVAREGNVVVQDGVELPLFVPSGSQSGIKVNGPWVIDACEETALTLELDGHRSVFAHPNGQGEWILRPVIRTAKVAQEPSTCEPPVTCVPEECASGFCEASGEQCAPAGAGAPCIEDVECLSNACAEGFCAPGEEGALCRVPADCADGFACVEGFCAVASPPPAL